VVEIEEVVDGNTEFSRGGDLAGIGLAIGR
jgi:hypothetical protein